MRSRTVFLVALLAIWCAGCMRQYEPQCPYETRAEWKRLDKEPEQAAELVSLAFRSTPDEITRIHAWVGREGRKFGAFYEWYETTNRLALCQEPIRNCGYVAVLEFEKAGGNWQPTEIRVPATCAPM
jgi:hypothetical protein